MRKFILAGLFVLAGGFPLLCGMTASHAAEGPWCHTFGGAQGGIENCSIQSLEIQGNGGSCGPNPRRHGNPPGRRSARPAGLYPWPGR